mmetsp:Transcript_9977/g.15056  ORF Transcript_9977/g.15056 Transcript_9977/m.15056 type:complete len:254 (-) Transcript_9977:2255-3016(-)
MIIDCWDFYTNDKGSPSTRGVVKETTLSIIRADVFPVNSWIFVGRKASVNHLTTIVEKNHWTSCNTASVNVSGTIHTKSVGGKDFKFIASVWVSHTVAIQSVGRFDAINLNPSCTRVADFEWTWIITRALDSGTITSCLVSSFSINISELWNVGIGAKMNVTKPAPAETPTKLLPLPKLGPFAISAQFDSSAHKYNAISGNLVTSLGWRARHVVWAGPAVGHPCLPASSAWIWRDGCPHCDWPPSRHFFHVIV